MLPRRSYSEYQGCSLAPLCSSAPNTRILPPALVPAPVPVPFLSTVPAVAGKPQALPLLLVQL